MIFHGKYFFWILNFGIKTRETMKNEFHLGRTTFAWCALVSFVIKLYPSTKISFPFSLYYEKQDLRGGRLSVSDGSNGKLKNGSIRKNKTDGWKNTREPLKIFRLNFALDRNERKMFSYGETIGKIWKKYPTHDIMCESGKLNFIGYVCYFYYSKIIFHVKCIK